MYKPDLGLTLPNASQFRAVGKESTSNSGDPDSIPGSGRSAGEETGYPLQYSWASLVAQLVKNQPAIWETLVQFLGWEDPLEKGKATHSSILAWRIPWTVWSMGSQRVGHDQVTFTSLLHSFPICLQTITAKSLQSCPTLCNPIDGSPPGSSVPGILQARTLE